MFFFLFLLIPFLLNYFYGVPPRIDWLANEALDFDFIYLVYNLHMLSFTIGYVCITYLSLRKEPKSSHIQIFRNLDYQVIYWVSTFFTILGLIIYIFGTGLPLIELIKASRFSWYKLDSSDELIMLLGIYCFSFVALFSYMDFNLGFQHKTITFLVYFAVILFILLAGGRKWLFFAMSGFVAGFCLKHSKVLNSKVVFSGIVIIFLGILWQYLRTFKFFGDSSINLSADSLTEAIPKLLTEGDISYFYRASLEATVLNVEKDTFYPGAFILRLLLLPFPTELTLGLKPEGIPSMFARDFGAFNEFRSGNLPPGIIGVFVLSFGWQLSIILAPLMMLTFVYKLDDYLYKSNSVIKHIVFASFCIFSLTLMRGSTGGLYYVFFQILILLAIIWFKRNFLTRSTIGN